LAAGYRAKRVRRKMKGEHAYDYSSEKFIPAKYKFFKKIRSGFFGSNAKR